LVDDAVDVRVNAAVKSPGGADDAVSESLLGDEQDAQTNAATSHGRRRAIP
jgi:hypothetical protein